MNEPRRAKERLGPPEVGIGREGPSPGAFRGCTALQAAGFQPSGLWSWERIKFYCSKATRVGVNLLRQPWEANALGQKLGVTSDLSVTPPPSQSENSVGSTFNLCSFNPATLSSPAQPLGCVTSAGFQQRPRHWRPASTLALQSVRPEWTPFKEEAHIPAQNPAVAFHVLPSTATSWASCPALQSWLTLLPQSGTAARRTPASES